MKGLKSLLFVGAMLCALTVAPRWAMAASSPFTVTVGTVVPNGSVNGAAAFTASSYPNYTGTLSVRKITVANTSSPTAEQIQLWDVCTSSTVATLKWTGVVAASSTLNVDITPRLMNMTSPCFSKGTFDSTDVIKATLWYE